MFSVSSPRSLPCPHSAPATLKSKRGLRPPRRPQQFLLLASKRCIYGGTELPVGSRGTLTAGRRESGGVGVQFFGVWQRAKTPAPEIRKRFVYNGYVANMEKAAQRYEAW